MSILILLSPLLNWKKGEVVRNLKLLCIPYAGGSASIFSKWNIYLDSSIELCPLDMAGHGSRISEDICDSVHEVAISIYEHYKEHFVGEYCLFGHSLGSLVSFELYHLLKNMGKPLPRVLIFSGMSVPDAKRYAEIDTSENMTDFMNKLYKKGRIPKEVLDPDFIEFFERIIRADYNIVQGYKYQSKSTKIMSKTYIFSGHEDSSVNEEIYRWNEFISEKPTYRFFDGGHLFINIQYEKMIDQINTIIIESRELNGN